MLGEFSANTSLCSHSCISYKHGNLGFHLGEILSKYQEYHLGYWAFRWPNSLRLLSPETVERITIHNNSGNSIQEMILYIVKIVRSLNPLKMALYNYLDVINIWSG